MVPVEEPIVQEMSTVLREWGGIMKQLYIVSAICVRRVIGAIKLTEPFAVRRVAIRNSRPLD